MNLRPRLAFLLTLVAVTVVFGGHIDAAVTEAWVQRSTNSATSVIFDQNQNVIVIGTSQNGHDSDYSTAKYAAANGALLWEKHYDGPANNDDKARAVAVDGNGNVIVTGESRNSSGGSEFSTIKYAGTNGLLLWERRYVCPSNYAGSATATALDDNGNVAVTGYSFGSTNLQWYTAKYSGSNGSLLWEKSYDVPGEYYDSVNSVAIDRNGNVLIMAQAYHVVFGWKPFFLAKYAALDGAVIWEQYDNKGNQAIALAVDSSGNVAIAGRGNFPDYYTAKFRGADGVLLWETLFDELPPEADYSDYGQGVAVDRDGNVIMTGYSNGTGSHYYTAKYAAENGTLLWEKRHFGPVYSTRPYAVAVDENGNVVVTGTSVNSEDRLNFYTVKYATGDGTVLWEKRYDDFYLEMTSSRSLAVSPSGAVAVIGYAFGEIAGEYYATISYQENLPALSVKKTSTDFRLSFPGAADHSYQIQRAFTITGPWVTNATITALSNGVVHYVDTNIFPGSVFYRTASVP